MIHFILALFSGLLVSAKDCTSSPRFYSHTKPEGHWKYAVFVDAGSTKTKFGLYRYEYTPFSDVPQFVTGALPEIIDFSEVVTEDEEDALKLNALSKWDAEVDGPTFVEALAVATCLIPGAAIETPPLWISATAGMRSSPDEDVSAVYEQLTELVGESVFTLKNIRTVSGDEEAMYLWVARNYKAGAFSERADAPKPVGVVVQGGASLQMAFIPETSEIKEDSFDIVIGDQYHRIFSKSWMGKGHDMTVEDSIEYLKNLEANQGKDESALVHPCLTDKYDPNTAPEKEFGGFMGTGSYDETECTKLVIDLLELGNEDYCHYSHGCKMGHAWVPQTDEVDFLAGTYLNYVADYVIKVGTSLNKESLTPQDISDNVAAYCNLGEQSEYETSGCIGVSFAAVMLQEGLGFDPAKQMHFMGGFEWTLGALVNELSLMGWDRVSKDIIEGKIYGTPTPTDDDEERAFLISILVIVVVVFCMLVVLSIMMCKMMASSSTTGGEAGLNNNNHMMELRH